MRSEDLAAKLVIVVIQAPLEEKIMTDLVTLLIS
jgi:hypothetical protein